MAVREFAVELIEELLGDNELALTENDIRFFDKGTTAGADEALDDHIRWRNARLYNEDSNVIRNSILIVQITYGESKEYINFHMGDLYRLYRKDGMKKVLPVIKQEIRNIKGSTAQSFELLNQFGDYEAIKDALIIRPLNYDNNEKALSKAVYRTVGDMALVLYISLGRMGQGKGGSIMSAMAPREVVEGWGLDEQEVFDAALANTMRLQPPVLCSIAGGFGGQLRPKHTRFMEDESISFDFDNPLAPVLTTEQEVNGAIAAFYPGVLERLYRMIGEEFYLVFTSISDIHIHAVSGNFKVSTMRGTLSDMNREMNQPRDVLTRQIYRYSKEKNELVVV